jgi:hypothetical protein
MLRLIHGALLPTKRAAIADGPRASAKTRSAPPYFCAEPTWTPPRRRRTDKRGHVALLKSFRGVKLCRPKSSRRLIISGSSPAMRAHNANRA